MIKLGGYELTLLKEGKDITESLFNGGAPNYINLTPFHMGTPLYFNRRRSEEVVRNGECSEFATSFHDSPLAAVNAVYHSMAAWNSADILNGEYDVSVVPADPAQGLQGFLSLIDGEPFLSFEAFNMVHIPLGNSIYQERFSNASKFEKLLATAVLGKIGKMRTSDIQGEPLLSLLDVKPLYSTYGGVEKVQEDLVDAQSRGLLDLNPSWEIPLVGVFSWHPFL